MQLLFKDKDASSVAFFRIAFGLIMCWEVCRYFYYGWIERYWIEPDFYFTYGYFHWLSPWDGNLMYIHFFFLGVLAIFIAFGLFYRLSTILFFVGFTYIFLLDKSNYLNHFYLISLLSFLMIWIPANRKYAIDAVLFPKIKSDTIPYWSILALQLQLGIAYFFGGIAKINGDWLRGEPMRDWLSDVTDFPVIGKYFTHEWAGLFFSYSGLFLDLLIVPFLFWRKTRIPAFILICSFHFMNANLFKIGIFPWFMMAATTIYFNPDWVSKILKRIKFIDFNQPSSVGFADTSTTKKMLSCGFIIYFLVQFLYPLRHNFIPGNVSWTEEGHRYAWHMKLRQKSAKVKFKVVDNETGKTRKINPKDKLSKRQARKMSTRPDMILQYAHHLAKKYNKKGDKDISVYAQATAKLNDRDYQELIKPEIDLSKQRYNVFKNDWITPLDKDKVSVEK